MQGDVALSLSLVAHPYITQYTWLGSCRASTQIATQLLISVNVILNIWTRSENEDFTIIES